MGKINVCLFPSSYDDLIFNGNHLFSDGNSFEFIKMKTRMNGLSFCKRMKTIIGSLVETLSDYPILNTCIYKFRLEHYDKTIIEKTITPEG
ncbi:hypothetical protein JCM16163A_19190 [Paenibacillus sp. YK5]|nr:hypothetical protein PN4B1_14550 [Paenibacillus naphthalenovorans]